MMLNRIHPAQEIIAVTGKGCEVFHYTTADKIQSVVDLNSDVYFTPAIHLRNGMTKGDFSGSRVLWVDVDHMTYPTSTIPPTFVVFSGHGWHLYWMLDEIADVETVERLNALLIADVPNADKACWNINRLLRVPGTINTKMGARETVYLKRDSGNVYTVRFIELLSGLDNKTRHKIRTGDSRGFKSRSERDWSVIVSLIKAGYTDEFIKMIFGITPVGDKVRDAGGESYLNATIRSARNSKQSSAQSRQRVANDIEECEDGYHMVNARGSRRVSTFVISPQLLLVPHTGSGTGEDAIVGDVSAAGYNWKGVTFSRSAFGSTLKMDRECPVAAWQWLGRDEDVRMLLPYLMDKMRSSAIGLQRVASTMQLGLHLYNGRWYFIGNDMTFSVDGEWSGFDGPIAWLPSRKEHPVLDLSCNTNQWSEAARSIPGLNSPDAIWVMIGWYTAAMYKTWLECVGIRMPILNVTGTKGSGKTTLIQRVFLPMFGQVDPKSFDAGTTRFVTLALLGSSVSVPIAFSEFRYESVSNFIRYILLSYDTGHDARGRADQTTVDYPLSAPFSVDGEDLIGDAAAQERIVVARLRPETISEDGDACRLFHETRRLYSPQNGFMNMMVRRVVSRIVDGSASSSLVRARQEITHAFPVRMPERVRNNHIVAMFGCLEFCDATGIDPPSADVMSTSIGSVFSVSAGRSRILVDDLVEDIANAIRSNPPFRHRCEGGYLWFQLASAHTWWIQRRRSQGRASLERDAIRSQLREVEYSRAPEVRDGVLMFCIDLIKAQKVGLDVPSNVGSTFSITSVGMDGG